MTAETRIFDQSLDKNNYDRDGWREQTYHDATYGTTRILKIHRDTETEYDPDGYSYEGFDKDGYNGSFRDRDGFDRAGYDKDGYDKDGYNRFGYDRYYFRKGGGTYNTNKYDLLVAATISVLLIIILPILL